jgi:hypothetical protein
MRIRLSTILASCLSLILLTTTVSAQQPAAAVLSGRVTDQTGAAIAAVKIIARSKATDATSETSTNDSGLYALSELPAGEYEVRAQATNFAETIYESVVLQVGRTTTLDITPSVKGVRDQISIQEPAAPLVNTSSAVIDDVISSSFIESLPLNGRNYLELALLVPGNAPAPNFDPTKTNTVVISSAGQLGRGGNITIDGGDNNDDVVGGSLNNIPQDAVQEFQIASNQFSAVLGRSGSSVANVVTKSGSNAMHGAFSLFLRDNALQALPATLDRSLGLEPSFDRQQYAASLGGPIVKDKAWWFGALEFRNQDGAILVGERNTATATITRGLAPAPLNDLIGMVRSDWRASAQDSLTFRYSLQLEDDVAASTLARAIGSASQRQSADNHFQTGALTWTRVLSARAVNRFSFNENNFRIALHRCNQAHNLPSQACRTEHPSACRRKRGKTACSSPTASPGLLDDTDWKPARSSRRSTRRSCWRSFSRAGSNSRRISRTSIATRMARSTMTIFLLPSRCAVDFRRARSTSLTPTISISLLHSGQFPRQTLADSERGTALRIGYGRQEREPRRRPQSPDPAVSQRRAPP